jgi:hypothetical protein
LSERFRRPTPIASDQSDWSVKDARIKDPHDV